jgi:Ca-activated chloride channel family protein
MALARFLITFVFCLVFSLAAQAEGQRVILVLDASGSMWGQINGATKMDIAKQVVGKVVGKWNAEDELGLVAYGHREKGACTDIETLLEPGALDAGQFMSAVNGLTPKGKTPMTQAVRQAAESLKFTEKAATVILVSDGIETCDPDPCAVADELEKMGIGLTVHTVGFGLDDKGAVAQLKCLAERTGGLAVLADNADELESALNKTVEAQPAPAPEPVAAAFNFTGHVVMAEGVELPQKWDQPGWTFAVAQDGQAGDYIRTEYGSDVKIDVEKPGEMVVTIATDFASVVVPFTLQAGGTAEVKANLNAGIASFKGMRDAATQMKNDGAAWVISKADGTYITTTYGVTPLHLINAGEYKVKLHDGQAESEVAFTVLPGKTVDVVVTLGAGAARVSGTYSAGGEALPDSIAVELRKPAGISGEKEHIATEYGNNKVFKAAAGDYVAMIYLDYATAEAPFTITAGQEIPVQVNLNAGFLAINAAGAKALDVFAAEKALDGSRKRIGSEYAATLNKALNAGSYHVVVYGEGDVVLAEKDVVVTAGQRTEVVLP